MKPFWLVLALALGLRLFGIGFGLPEQFHQDEPIVVNHAVAYGTGDFHPHFFKIPPLASYLLFFLYGIFFGCCRLVGMNAEAFALLFFKDPTAFYLIGRIALGVMMGTASVGVLYIFAKRIFDTRTAVLASLFLALNYLHVRDSHYIYVDIPMLLAVLLVFEALSRYRPITASVWAGVAVAFKYIAAPVFLPVLIVMFQKEKTPADFWKKALVSTLVAAAVYAVLNPFGMLDFKFFLSEIFQQAKAEGSAPILHHLAYSLFGGCGVLVTLTGIVGCMVLWKKTEHHAWIVFAAVYYAMSVMFSQPYERYVLPIMPFLGLAAAALLIRVPKKIFWLAAFLCLLEPAGKIFLFERMISLPDTRTEAKAWFEEAVPVGSRVLLDHPFFSPRLSQTREQTEAKLGRVEASDSHAAAKRKKIELLTQAGEGRKAFTVFYADLSGDSKAPFLTWSPVLAQSSEALRREDVQYYVRYRYPGENSFFEKEIRPRATLIQIFSPYRNSRKIFTTDTLANVGLPFRWDELWSRTRPGPYLEIYKLQ